MRAPVIAVMVAAAAILGGCGRADDPTVAAPPAQSPSGEPLSGQSSSSSGQPTGKDGCSAALTITEDDNGKVVCATQGSRIAVLLTGTADDRWTPVQTTGNALTPAVDGRGSLQVGVTGSFFTASAAGEESITSTRAACPTAQPGSVRCQAMIVFRVTVDVR